MSDTRTKVMHVVGARPNFMKVAPVMRAMNKYGDQISQVLVHTGQHYDYQMSALFFEELQIPDADYNLGIGSAPHGEQTGRMLIESERVLLEEKPAWVFVYGDTNSALAATLAAAKLHIPVAHVEAGLRSFDRAMPEEINRIVTDHIADLLLTPSQDGDDNLAREGVSPEKVRFVGNVMIDSLVEALEHRQRSTGALAELSGCQAGDPFVLVTLHRPSNVDDPSTLQDILTALLEVSKRVPVIFPVHPRTQQRMRALGPSMWPGGLRLLDPLGYVAFLGLMQQARVVVTDSGGIQEETTYLGIPCLTVRANTERPVTITHGTNRLVASEGDALVAGIEAALQRSSSLTASEPPPLWDGHAGQRIVETLLELTRPTTSSGAKRE